MRKIDLVGLKFGRLKVCAELTQRMSGCIAYQCLCDCGRSVPVSGGHLRSGHTQSCGCLHKEKLIESITSHDSYGTHEYHSWTSMKGRCQNKNNKRFARYGGRGISVCDRWQHSFSNFLLDMGKRPSINHSLDRINNDGNYSPDNCRWATPKEQASNRQSTKTFYATSPIGRRYISRHQRDFSSTHNLNHKVLNQVLKGKGKTHKDWTFEYA